MGHDRLATLDTANLDARIVTSHGDRSTVGKTTLADAAYGQKPRMLGANHPSYAPLLSALEQIKAAGDDARAHALVDAYTQQLGSRYRDSDPPDNKRSEDWQYNVLENFRRALHGDRMSLDHLVKNVSWVPQYEAQRILALAAPKTAQSSQMRARTELARLLTFQGAITSSSIESAAIMLRVAGFKAASIAAADRLLRAFHDFLGAEGTGADALSARLVTCVAMLDTAAQQGTLALADYHSIRTRWVTWEQQYGAMNLTPAQRTQRVVAHNAVDNHALMETALRTLDEVRRLRAWVDQKHGVLGTGWGDGYVIKRLVGELRSTGGVLGGEGRQLEAALALPDTDYAKADRVRAANTLVRGHIDEIRFKGTDVVTSQDEKRETGFHVLGYMKIGSAYIPVIGKPLSVALAGVESLARYESGDWGAAHALANVLTSAIEAKWGESIVGEGTFAARALRRGAFVLASELGTELAKILGDKRLTAEQRDEEIRKAVVDCTIKAFLGALAQIGKSTATSDDAHYIATAFATRLGILGDHRVQNALSILQ